MISQEVILAAQALASQLLDLVDVDHAKELLSEAARERANLAADIAEDIKFRGEKK